MVASESSLRTSVMDLLVQYHASPTIQLRNHLVRVNAGLVRKVAHQVSHQCAEPYEDLEQLGYLGLIRAIERFDPRQGCAFSSFAVPYIRGEMLHFLRDRSSSVKIPRRWQKLHKEGQRATRELTEALGRQPRDQEIAASLCVSVDEYRQSKLARKNRMPLSLDATVCHQTDSQVLLGDTIPDMHYQTLQTLEEDRIVVHAALKQLEDKTREVIEFVFLKDLSRKEVAERIGVSPMTVTRRIQKGVQELLELIEPQPVVEDEPAEEVIQEEGTEAAIEQAAIEEIVEAS
ncbi:RNA polymerase sigma factor SigF [Leptolyngbya sp. FACHB-261]|uniref:RNA polymerase sigma factor SigF n=1 Tax=Leptolyngbya sp. FACHB-261 TaxID=2692806 RepID=UPI0016864BFA|nr:RNA polymerase sigma factor SigF [Leptolyngbya sp. FACHB-261]MBD2100920.1 RNA polymerase sigma factor SigF [Leptolyngbya sp. FACHB-261]